MSSRFFPRLIAPIVGVGALVLVGVIGLGCGAKTHHAPAAQVSGAAAPIHGDCFHPAEVGGQRTFATRACYDDAVFHDATGAASASIPGMVTLQPGQRVAFSAATGTAPARVFYVTDWTNDYPAEVSFDGTTLTIALLGAPDGQRISTLVPPAGASAECETGAMPLVCHPGGVQWLAFTTS